MEPGSLGDGVPRHPPSTSNQSNVVLDSTAPQMAQHKSTESGGSSSYMAPNALSITHDADHNTAGIVDNLDPASHIPNQNAGYVIELTSN